MYQNECMASHICWFGSVLDEISNELCMHLIENIKYVYQHDGRIINCPLTDYLCMVPAPVAECMS